MTRKITPAQLDEIEAVAKEATPGPWEVIGGGEYVTPIGVMVAPDDGGVSPEDATHIATFDPSTTLALVAEVRELRARLSDVSSVAQSVDASAGGAVEYCHPDTLVWRNVALDLFEALGEEA